MKLTTSVLRFFIPFIFVIVGLTQTSVSARQPNFIIIFCDDLGYADIGVFGSTKHRTPNIDRMAAEGMKLTSFYSTSGVCTPSRSSLMTGCYPKRVGLDQNEKGGWVLFPGNQRGLNADELTMAEMLKQAGYATAIVGKWHLGDQPVFLPTRHGFDSYFGIPFSNDMGKLDRPVTVYPPTPLLENETVVELEPDQRYLTQRYTEKALEFIEANRDQPFFLYLPHSMPHWPQYSTNRFTEQSKNGAWGDSVEEIDWSTGEILKRLKELGIDDDTLVIFTSDNGGALHHGAVNTPLRGGKGTTWEGGHRVCCVARWPGKIAANSSSDQVAVTFDLLPTFATLAGQELPQDRRIDGKDISGLLTGDTETSPHERFYYYFRDHLNAVRSGPWKLYVRHRPRRNNDGKLANPELYHLHDDIGETKNVAAENPKVVARLMSYLDEMREDLGDGTRAEGANVRPAGFVEDARTLTQNPPAELETQRLFHKGQEGYHTFRIPALLVTQRGRLLAFCEGRKTSRRDHGDLDLVMKQSDDFGNTWSDLRLIYEEGGDKKITIGNPCPVVDQTNGRIWLPFCRDNDDVFVMYSDDEGDSWSTPREITADVKPKGWGWYATGPGIGIQLTRGPHRGRLVIPCDHREVKNGKSLKMAHVFYSDDHGETWELGGFVSDYSDECQVVELEDGRLLVNCRNDWAREGGRDDLGFKRIVAISKDGGESWEQVEFDETLIEPTCQASLIKFSNDNFRRPPLLFSNPASRSKRESLTVRVSRDEGMTWPFERVLHPGPAAYSCLNVLPDRSIVCLYEAGEDTPYEGISFARFPLTWLPEQK